MDYDMPLGLSMTMALKPEAIDCFAALSDPEKKAVIERAKQASSRREMQSIVNDIISSAPPSARD